MTMWVNNDIQHRVYIKVCTPLSDFEFLVFNSNIKTCPRERCSSEQELKLRVQDKKIILNGPRGHSWISY